MPILSSFLAPLLGDDWLFLFVPVYLIASFIYFAGDLSVRVHKWLFWALTGFLILRAGLRVLWQYLIWSAGPPGSFFLPPHQSLAYFWRYSFTHHLAALSLTFLAIALLAAFFQIFRRAKESPGRKLWRSGEQYIFLSGVLLLRWPLIIPYLFLGVLAAVVYFLAARYAFRSGPTLLNITPFFPAMVLPLLYFRDFFISFFYLTALVMPL